MSAIGKTVSAIRELCLGGVAKNAKKIAAHLATLPATAATLGEGPVANAIHALVRKWPDGKAIKGEPDVFESEVTELLLDLS